MTAIERHSREPLRLYRPMPVQELFHRSRCKIRLLRGGNRSGKSASMFSELASAITGIPITASSGKKIPWYHAKGNRIFWIIGWNEDHIGQTVHRYLFREGGAFKIIRDEHTGVWRPFNGNCEYDRANVEKLRDAEPLIPNRFIDKSRASDGFAWEDKGKNIFAQVHFVDGSILYAFPSTALQAKQGDPVTELYIDEDIRFDDQIPEFMMRLVDMPDPYGRFVWGAFPHCTNQALMDMSDLASKEEGSPKQQYKEFQLIYSENTFVPDDQKSIVLRGMSPEERRARDKGEFVIGEQLMYPDFSQSTHGIGPIGLVA